MADLAFVFHWAPRDMDSMSPEEIAIWLAKAKARLRAMTGEDDG